MKTDYKNINSFDAATIFVIAVGFVIIGVILFSSLTPRTQANFASSIDILDMHQQFSSTVDSAETILNAPNEFYNQFYLALLQVRTIVPEASQAPKELVSNLITDVSLIVNNLSDQVVAKYQAGDQMQIAVAQAYEGQVLGATVEANLSTDSIQNEGCHSDVTADSILKIPYEYKGPDMQQIKLSLNKLIQK